MLVITDRSIPGRPVKQCSYQRSAPLTTQPVGEEEEVRSCFRPSYFFFISSFLYMSLEPFSYVVYNLKAKNPFVLVWLKL